MMTRITISSLYPGVAKLDLPADGGVWVDPVEWGDACVPTRETSARAFLASGLAATTVLAAAAPVARAIDLVIVDPSVKQYMDSRDEAMRMKCEGGMMDCDGDRREYAKKATENFIRRNSGDVFEPPPCTVAEACTTDILGAAMAGLNGLTTSEKLEKMGKDGNAVNATRPYFGDAVGNEAEAR